jgi:CheY-like chemotaxis protein
VNRIFVVDDEPAMGENIQRMLKFPETTVTAYADPIKGLADALAHPPDLVLLDMRMPGMSGEEVFARLHQAHPNSAHRVSHRVRIGGGRGGGHAQWRIRLPAETVQAGRSPAGGEAGALARRVGSTRSTG